MKNIPICRSRSLWNIAARYRSIIKTIYSEVTLTPFDAPCDGFTRRKLPPAGGNFRLKALFCLKPSLRGSKLHDYISRLTPSKSKAFCCTGVGQVILSKVTSCEGSKALTLFFTIVARSASRVAKLWTGKLSGVRLEPK